MTKLKLLFVVITLSLVSQSYAQNKGPHELQISLVNEAVTIPFTSPYIIYHPPGHWGGSVGINWYYHHRNKKYFYWNLTFQMFDHQFLYTGAQLYGSWNFRYAFSRYFTMSTELGLGYFHRFTQIKEYKLVNGEYDRVNRFGLPGAMMVIGIQLNWYPKNFFYGGSFFWKYQISGLYKFAKEIPLLPSTYFHFGITYPIAKLKKSKT